MMTRVPRNLSWTIRWWRRPGASLWSATIDGAKWVATLKWCGDVWGIALKRDEAEQGVIEWHLDDDGLMGSVLAAVRKPLVEELRARSQGIRDMTELELRIVHALSAALRSAEWVSGRRLRQHLKFANVDQFKRVVDGLVPRVLRVQDGDRGDHYSLTLPGLFLSEDKDALGMVEVLLRAIKRRYEIDPDARDYDWDDLSAAGATLEDVKLAWNVASVALLSWGGSNGDGDGPPNIRLGMPQDAEELVGAIGLTAFRQYVLDVANGGPRYAAWNFERPYFHAPLVLDGDGGQTEYTSIGVGSAYDYFDQAPKPPPKGARSAGARVTPTLPKDPAPSSQQQGPSRTQSPSTRSENAMPATSRPTLFIGSTVEALPIARAVHSELDHDLEVTLWNHGLFEPGTTTWNQLTNTIARNYDFALFIFSGDDEVTSRGQQSLAVRDNLLIEYGLFVGVLGAERVFFLHNRSHRPKIASDLGGVTPLTFGDREDGNVRSAVSPACEELRKVVTRRGRVQRTP